MTDKSTSPEVLAELRELRRRTDINGITIPYGLLLSWNHLPSLIADSERLAEAEKQHGNLLAELNLCRPYRSQYNALTERLREAEKKISELSLECHSYLTQLSQPHEDPRLRLAVEVIEKYRTSHLHGCASEIRGQPCSCGFDDAIAKIGRTE